MFSTGFNSGARAGRSTSVRLSGTTRSLARCHPARSISMTPWAPGATACATSARCRLMACVSHRGSTRAGSFGSRLFEDGERLVAMFGEVLLALDRTVPPASMDGEGGVSQGGEGLGGVARSGAAGVLAAGPIADVVQAVLDSPMPSRDVEQ